MKVFGMDSLNLPLMGEEVKFGEIGLSFKRNNKEAQALSPLTGIVASQNYQITKKTDVAKEKPYNEGWLMVLEPTEMKKDLKNLLFGKESTEWIQSEHQKLAEMISSIGMTYADGGQINDIVGNIPDLSWKNLTKEFLHTN